MGRFEELQSAVYESGLYSRIEIRENDHDDLKKLFSESYSFDAYCVGCREASIFFPLEEAGNLRLLADCFSLTERTQFGNAVCFKLEAHCARCGLAIRIYLSITSDCIIKIGQYPSVASIENGAFIKYDQVLGDRFEDYTKATALFAHGYGIGSLVYLRRVAAFLIDAANEKLKSETGLDENANQKPDPLSDHFDKEAVSMLKPLHIIPNESMHELSEEESLKHYIRLAAAVKAVLDKKLALQEREQKRRSVTLYRIDGLKDTAAEEKSGTGMQTSA